MSIKDQQIQDMTNHLILSELKTGKVPTSYVIQEKLEQAFDGRTPGTPEFVPYMVEKYQVSSKEAFNAAMKSLSNDLSICFKELVRVNNEVVDIFEYYESQKGNIAAEIEKLSLQLSSTEEDAEGVVKIINFKHFYESNFNNNPVLNYPKTTAFIDIQERAVQLQKITSLTKKIDLSKAEVSITNSSSMLEKRSLGELTSLISDIGNDPVQKIFASKKDKDESIVVTVTLPEAKRMNTIQLATKSLSKCKIALKISNEEGSFRMIGKTQANSDVSWSFEPFDVKQMVFTISKNEAEGFVDDEYLYHFILENISGKLETYQEESVHATAPINYNGTIDHVIMQCEQNIPAGTEIEHFIGVIDGSPINWKKIEQRVPTNLDLMTEKTIVAQKGSSNYGQKDGNLYAVTNIESYVDQLNIKLLPGYQMFKKEVVHPKDNEFEIKAIRDADVVSIDYVDCESYELNAENGQVVILSQYVRCSDPIIVDKKFVKDASNVMVFLNNVLQNPTDGKYSLKLLKGENKLEVMFQSKGIPIIHNFNMKTASFEIYAEKAMKAASPFSVEKDSSLFCVKGGKVLIKSDIFKLSTSNSGMRFKLDYKCPKDPLSKSTKFAIMSVLRSRDKHLTPKIYNQTIVMR